jgi:hypothetical protein
MCQKSCKVFKQFYAVILTSPVSVARSLQVFKVNPTKEQIENVIARHVIGKIEPVPFIYSEKPKVEVIPIQIPVDILYH